MTQHTASGAGAPTSPPPSIGAHYTDTSTGDQYLSKGVLSPSDWVLQGGADGKKIVEPPGGATALTLAHANTFLAILEGGEVTIPLRSSVNFPVGTEIEIGQLADDPVALVAAEGVQVIQKKSTKLETNGRGTMLRLKLVAQDIWMVTGDLVPLTYLAGVTWGSAIPTSTPLYAPLQYVPELGLTLSMGVGSTSTAYPWSEDGESWTNGSAIPVADGGNQVRPKRAVWSPHMGALLTVASVDGSGLITATPEDVVAIKLLTSGDGKVWTLSEDLTLAPDFLTDPYLAHKRIALNPTTGHGQILCSYVAAEGDGPALTHSLVTTNGGETWSEVTGEVAGAAAPPAMIAWSDVANAFIAVDMAGFLWSSTDLGVWVVQGATGGMYAGAELFAEDPDAGVMLVSLGGDSVLRSVDAGVSWVSVAVEGSSRLTNLHRAASGFLAGDESASFVHTSLDGAVWRSLAAPQFTNLAGIQQLGESRTILAVTDYSGGTSDVYMGAGILSPVE